MQDFLNRSDALWGIVTNEKRLRLLRNTVRFSKPSFVEFDLEAIFAGNLYSEFVLFYRLVHVTRLPREAGDAHECWLERYYQQGIEQGGRVRERLRDGVKDALEVLGTGFLCHRDSEALRAKLAGKDLSAIEYYRQLLRLIYRLLFLMVAEERRLLFVRDPEQRSRQDIYDRWYSIERLRKRAESRFSDDGHDDLWEGLKQTFRLFEDSAHAAQLGLTALDGELFGRFSAEKPTLAILTDHALSAGYLLASAARQIIIPEHGRAGSIGVVTLHADLSAALEQRGTKVTVLRAGTQKMSANPFEPLAGDTIQRLLADLEASRNTFAEPKRRTIAGVRPSLSDLRMRAAMRLKRLTDSSKRSTP